MMICGIVASGKTTLARRLSERLGIPHYEGDCIAWGFPGEKRYKRSDREQAEIIARIDAQSDWIAEGTYRESQKDLFARAEVIIFLDTPFAIRLVRILSRFIRQRLGMEHCHYKPTWEILGMMFRWTWDFERKRKEYLNMLAEYGDRVLHVQSAKEVLRRFPAPEPSEM